MASLSTALNIATSSLAVASGQTAVISRNIANVSDPEYSRKSAKIISLLGGGVAINGFTRSADGLLLARLLDANGSAAGSRALVDGIERLSRTVGDPLDDSSLAGSLGAFRSALELFEADPSSALRAGNALQTAAGLVRSLNAASATVQQVRKDADSAMVSSVDRINSLLQQFKIANDAVVRGDGTPQDITEHLDERDRILKQLSEEIGIRTVTRENNDIAIFTDGGVTLFETVPRAVTMQATAVFDASTSGQRVFVDGVPVVGSPAAMASATGRLVGLAQLRDETAVTYQRQLDEVARGLIEAFAESDQTGGGGPDATGLFSYAGSPAVPASGIAVAGIAADIRVNALFDPLQGGSAFLLRDGGANGAVYLYNATGASGYSDRLGGLVDGIASARAFDSASGLPASASLLDFSLASAGWIEGLRQSATKNADFEQAVQTRTADALQRKTGVNIDEEMTVMLDLERSFQASSKIIAAVDAMLAALLEAAS